MCLRERVKASSLSSSRAWTARRRHQRQMARRPSLRSSPVTPTTAARTPTGTGATSPGECARILVWRHNHLIHLNIHWPSFTRSVISLNLWVFPAKCSFSRSPSLWFSMYAGLWSHVCVFLSLAACPPDHHQRLAFCIEQDSWPPLQCTNQSLKGHWPPRCLEISFCAFSLNKISVSSPLSPRLLPPHKNLSDIFTDPGWGQFEVDWSIVDVSLFLSLSLCLSVCLSLSLSLSFFLSLFLSLSLSLSLSFSFFLFIFLSPPLLSLSLSSHTHAQGT